MCKACKLRFEFTIFTPTGGLDLLFGYWVDEMIDR